MMLISFTLLAASLFPISDQALARKIGETRMEEWIKKLNYGDLNTTSGIDVFWLPAPDRSPILISPDEQAKLLAKLTKGELPLSRNTLKILRDVMTAKSTENGTLYGKTGSGGAGKDSPPVGWFVGYMISGKTTLAFACLLTGENAAGKDAQAAMEKLFLREGLL
jgi:beta-lactamase class D